MNKKLLLAAPLALAAGAVLATPASAQGWNYGSYNLRGEIAQLDYAVDHAAGVSRDEQRQLNREVDRLQDLYRDYARNGLSRYEADQLGRQIASVRADLTRQSHDWDGRDRHDRGRHYGHDRR